MFWIDRVTAGIGTITRCDWNDYKQTEYSENRNTSHIEIEATFSFSVHRRRREFLFFVHRRRREFLFSVHRRRRDSKPSPAQQPNRPIRRSLPLDSNTYRHSHGTPPGSCAQLLLLIEGADRGLSGLASQRQRWLCRHEGQPKNKRAKPQ